MPDFVLKITIPSAKVAIDRDGILKEKPVPTTPDPASTPTSPLPSIPQYTDVEWIVKLIEDYLFRLYLAGHDKIIEEANLPEPDWF